ncbi:competence protein CoiA family protein [Bacillus sp. JJ634]
MHFKLPFGLKKDNTLVHISEVESGLKCNCVCPSCYHPLIAKKGPKTTHHFAHDKGKDCEYGLETSLHLAAKEVLEKYKKIVLPEVFLEGQSGWRLSKEIELNFDDVRIEMYHQGIVPDVLIYVQGKPLMVEITVTHKTGEEKIQKVRKQGISILEINLEHFERDFSLEDLEKEVIYNTSNKNWLLNIKAERLKELAYLASERKIFKDGKIPFCPIGSKYKGRYGFSWSYDCATCEFCLDIQHETVGALYDKKGFPESTIVDTTVFCLGKNRINNSNKLIQFLKKKRDG